MDIGGVPVGNIVLVVFAVLLPSLLFWFLVRVPRFVDGIGERYRRYRRTRSPEPTGPPIERLAADLRRVHRALADYPPGTPNVRRRATRQAYDALLGQACAVVEVEHRLAEIPEGVERDVERLRLEEALRTAGLTVP